MSPISRNRSPKKPFGAGRYACAEDLCDPYEIPDGTSNSTDDGDSPRPKPRAHAVRLLDELDAEPSNAVSDAPRRSRSAPPTACPLPNRERNRAAEASAPLDRPTRPLHQRPVGQPAGQLAGRSAVSPAFEPTSPYAILSVKPSGEGETVAVTLSVPIGMNEESTDIQSPPDRERLRLHLLLEQYTDLRPKEGSITREDAESLLAAGRFCAAVMRGMRLLSYGDRSARRLAYQLTMKGIDRENADRAAAYLVQKGLIHENDTARLRAEQDVRKLWGPRRIREDLRANGFAPDAVAEVMASLDEVDFEENCATLIRKKYRTIPDDISERRKMTAALARLGYDYDTVRAALRRMERDG